jgi:sugar phosphate isomerase/epimerase
MDIGQGEISWDVFFSSLAAVGFDGIITACIFAWEDRADESGRSPRYTRRSLELCERDGASSERLRQC